MNFVPSWRNGTPFLKRGRRRTRRRLKTHVYIVVLIGALMIVSQVYQNQQWNDFRNYYWAQEELLVFDGGGLRSHQNGNLGSSEANTNQQPPQESPNPDAKWNPKIVSTTRDVQLAEKPTVDAEATATDASANNKAASFLRDSRQSNHFSDFVKLDETDDKKEDISDITYEQAKQDREPLLEIFHDLGLAPLTVEELVQVPKWSEIQDLYGDKPTIVGMDTCFLFQTKVPLSERYIGVAGSFNTGTTAFGLSLQQNCRFPNRTPATPTANTHGKPAGKVVTNVHGMLNQVPWAKHKMAHERFDHTIDDTIPKDNVLPVVLVRDPYFWMHSMCQQGYGVRWDHNNKKHCPNLVPNDFDKKKFQKYSNASSMPVWMGQSYESGPHWDSLVHYWNDWYGSYYHNTVQENNDTSDNNSQKEKFPRLMIRFEDTLFHAKTVMKMVCACGGGIFSGNEEEEDDEEEMNIGFGSDNNAKATKGGSFRPILDEAKFEHRHVQNNLVSAIVKYGTDKTRYRNMTSEDLEFAQAHLDPELIQAFHYKLKP